MYFIVFATDKPGMREVREQVRPRHRAYLRQPGSHPVEVKLGGPTHHADGAMNGSLLVVEAGDLRQVEAFVRDDPYAGAGLFQSVDIRPWTCGLGTIAGGPPDA